jgi:hypothetical protein
MSKYNIDITPNLWYMVEEDKTYYFVEHEKSPIKKITDEQRAYIKETYDDKIEGVEFLYKEIISSRLIMEKKGLTLCLTGFRRSSSYFPVTALKNILNEPVQRVRNFETVIYIKDNRHNGEVYGNFNDDYGFMFFDFNFRIMRRAINDKATIQYNRLCNTDKKLKNIYYDYYRIPIRFDPDDENCVNYMPLERDFDFTKFNEYGMIVIPYTREKYIQLVKITNGFEKLGRALFDFLQSDMKKLLPEIENIRKIKNE